VSVPAAARGGAAASVCRCSGCDLEQASSAQSAVLTAGPRPEVAPPGPSAIACRSWLTGRHPAQVVPRVEPLLRPSVRSLPPRGDHPWGVAPGRSGWPIESCSVAAKMSLRRSKSAAWRWKQVVHCDRRRWSCCRAAPGCGGSSGGSERFTPSQCGISAVVIQTASARLPVEAPKASVGFARRGRAIDEGRPAVGLIAKQPVPRTFGYTVYCASPSGKGQRFLGPAIS